MTTYQSDIKTISSGEEMVFGILSDLNNLKKIADNPELASKVNDLQYDTDSMSFGVAGFGRIGLRIIERVPYSTIKMASENAPVSLTIDIALAAISENETSMQLTLNADLPAMIKMMVGSKLQDGINAIADLLAKALPLSSKGE